jgi:hypothetical protein
MVNKCPFAWVESKAWDFPALWDSISRHHPWNHPVSYFLILVIFFEETGFCNISQAQTSGSLGTGFGQLEVSNPEKKDFYAWLGLPTDYRAVAQLMLSDNDQAVRVHCKYFQYLTSVKHFGLEGCLGAQVGGHTSYKSLFRQGAQMLEKAFNEDDRPGYIRALNWARSNSAKKNGITESYFPQFWKFILPDTWFELGY